MLRIEQIVSFISTNCLEINGNVPYVVIGYSHQNLGFYAKLYYGSNYPSFSKPFEKLIAINAEMTAKNLQDEINQSLKKILDDVSKYKGEDIRDVLEERLYNQQADKIGSLIL
ncbi:hypothetical protein [Dactylococcopsis salina]|uniref:Uncharacterized protein n=1 Tax=Dactylococcopsis salina (strain PCC 8305) TaxID=13035 RepID=K9YY84_DACS8|nr:hypothetical protein [Dactylococcopsis salina]AFZ51260.1 hypothetical protein Dacsa_2682 [Dactylococcopsis salina PCC 8305]